MLKALLIDDEKWSRNVIRNFGRWDELGIEIVGEAEDGCEGLLLVEALNPDIIITDMNMPNIDGIELLRSLKALNSEARIIVISGYDNYEYMKQAIQSKAFEYILKPIDAIELNQTLRQCVKDLIVHHDTKIILQDYLDPEVVSSVVKKIKELRRCLQDQDLNQIKTLLVAIKNVLESHLKDEEISVRILSKYMTPLLVEDILPMAKDNEALINAYKEMEKSIKNGVTFESYIQSLIQLFVQSDAYHKTLIKESSKPVTELAKEYIDLRFKQDISLNKIARYLYTSKEYLSGAFKSKYHITISHYILKLKMEEAVKLLIKNMNHTQISENIGYNDVTYFYKVFKKYYGCTPGDYGNKTID